MRDAAFDALVDEHVQARYRLDPVAATIAGIHEHDARMGDLSAAGYAEREALSADALRRFESLPAEPLAPEQRADRALVLGVLAGERALRPFERWRRQPSLYSDAITRGAYYSLIREHAPLEQRLSALAERLDGAPAVIEAAMRNLDGDRVPPVWVVTAGESATAGATFVRAVLPTLAPEGAAKQQLLAAGKRAGDALDAFAAWLRDDLMRRARGTFAVGRDAFDALLRERELIDHDAVSLRRWGEELYRETEARLGEAARTLGDSDWRDSVARLREDHPSAEQLVAAYQTEVDRAREAVEVTRLATMPEGESLTVEPLQDFLRPTYPYAAYIGPAPFGTDRRGRFWVTLPDAAEPERTRRERLEGHPRRGIAVIACHEGYPGHHLQLVTAAQSASVARKAFRSNTFIEGWGLYVEELMTDLGHLDHPETRLLRLKDLLWRAARVIVDTGLATGEMSFEQAVRFMVEGPRLERPNAVAEVRRYTADPLQPSSYALGREAILGLRGRAKARGLGMREFHDRLLRCGSLPPALAAAEVGLEG